MSLRKDKGKSLIRFFDDYVVVDIETTGLDFSCHIIEISALKVSGNSIVDKFSSLVKPAPFFIPEDDFQFEHYVDSFVTDLTGITDDMLRNAPPLKQVISDFATFIGNSVLVGHNIAAFDSNFLYDAFINVSNSPLGNDFVDTMRIARWALPNLQHYRLSDIAEYYQIDHQTMHRGIADCQITQSCYEKLKFDLIQHYGTLDDFYNYVHSRLSKTSFALKAKDFTTDKTDFDISNPLYDSICVFTGTLEKMTRREAMQLVTDLGGHVADSVTKKTNFLILGNNDFCSTIKDGKSSKQKKAEKLLLEGQDISIISENVFYEMASVN